MNPPIPAVKNRDWVRTPIDAFVLAQLEANGLQPAPPADKATLIRRVTFDLIGLPPTPAEIDAFLADESPDAFAKVAERLLGSPAYGVRWGRHWLDVARYADSNGLDENLAFGNAWRYRDYVVDAFNRDKPFDRFLVEQIAGDLVADADQETTTATGFLVLGAKVLAEPDREKLEMDTIDEQLDTFGKTFLGMTVGCARCHDHKFDPLKQRDYYALAAIFKSTQTFASSQKKPSIKHWHEHSFATEADTASLKEVDANISKKKSAATTFKNEAIAKLQREARAKATEYLMASVRFEPGMPLTLVRNIAAPLGLHPHILHHCRLHLAYNKDAAFFARWHELAAVDDVAGIEAHYRPLFEEAETALAAARAAQPKVNTLADARLEPARAALYDLAGILAIPSKPEFAFDAETLAKYHQLAEEARIVESNAPDSPAAMGVADGPVSDPLPIHIRGSHHNLGEPVARDFPEVMRSPGFKPEMPSRSQWPIAVGTMDGRQTAPADGPRLCESNLALAFRIWHRGFDRELRQARRSPVASGTARLVGPSFSGSRLVDERTASADSVVEHLSDGIDAPGRNQRVSCRSGGPPALEISYPTAGSGADSRCDSGGLRSARYDNGRKIHPATQ